MTLYIYNTETQTKEALLPAIEREPLKIYACGPTVYNYAHIGNLRTYVCEDVLRRTLQYFNMPIKHVMNFTDVDDKTIMSANASQVPLSEHTQIYKQAFLEDLKTLDIDPVDIYASATDYVTEMIAMIQRLIKNGYAYQGKDQGVYYSIKAFPKYGRLSHLKLSDLKIGASERIFDDEYDKECASDFVLWKPYDPERDGNVYWESPFGRGRPGWHIECSAMATTILGDTIDLHIGGVDNIFPHHENEIAQSEGCTGKQFARYWMHVEHLIVDGRKMSKSRGNFYTLRDLLKKGYTGREVRCFLLSTHYRTQLNFTFLGLEASRKTLQRFQDFIYRLTQVNAKNGQCVKKHINILISTFNQALSDDLNMSVAVAAVFDFMKQINIVIDANQMTSDQSLEVINVFKNINRVLCIFSFDSDHISIPEDVEQAFENREKARKNKSWKSADRYRVYIESKGFTIEDGADGSRIVKK